jgi:hypothetical protein
MRALFCCVLIQMLLWIEMLHGGWYLIGLIPFHSMDGGGSDEREGGVPTSNRCR